jgi:membrane protein
MIALRTTSHLAVEAVKQWNADGATSRGASVAYYTMFSVAPLLLLVIALAGLFFGREAAQGAIIDEFKNLMGADAADALQHVVSATSSSGKGIIATAISIVLLLVGATSVLAELQSALNQIWKAPPLKASGVWSWLRSRLLSLSLIGAAGFLFSVSLIMSAALTAVERWVSGGLPEIAILVEAVNLVLGFVLTALFFAAIYKILPDVPLKWTDVLVGSLVTAALFNIGKYAIALYVSTSHVASAYGAAGALIIVFVWVFYSTQIFLLGAEFTKVYSARNGSAHAKPAAQRAKRPA